ncbi:MFS family permease [Clostridium punense]|uniref:MFS family permease n=2 Tax=Clostridium TaxID=1485 RepID=A0ABS4K1K0_9CLOT|nr:MFS transporter [Clostridium punense]EQB90288.1 hypothetical protein M918_00795 [Clostridium sp. BL8]MBP2021656.1 MFS family permease [Clostridium punense]
MEEELKDETVQENNLGNEQKKTKGNEKIRLWNKNFFLLWQGQLVSVFGDVIYLIALDFWILEVTGSTALMGLLSALTMVPRIVLGPFAGVFVDKWDRKKIIVLTDLIRGIFVTFVGIAGVFGFIQVWMVFVTGIISGLCSAFFNPSIASVKPDIVHESKLVQANSATSLASSSMDMIGNAIGGLLFVAIGAPYMFLFNGISYIFSAFTEVFIKVPKIERKGKEVTFKEDFKEGLKFMWGFKTLRNVFIAASAINFFANAAFILILPYFKETAFLGPEKYGFTMAAMSCSMVLGSIILSIITIKREHKFKIFYVSILVNGILFVSIAFIKSFPLLVGALFVASLGNVIFNTIFNTTMMIVVPSEKRGKVSALMGTMSMGLTPIGAVIGGVLGEILPLNIAITALFVLAFVFMFGCVNVKGARELIEYNKDEENIEVLIARTNGISS